MMKIETPKLLIDLTIEELDEIRKATFEFGQMKTLLNNAQNLSLKKTVYIFRGYNKYKTLMGWSSLEECTDYTTISAFVKKQYRRDKLGTTLINQAKLFHENSSMNPSLRSSPWDKNGRLFFESLNIERGF